MKCDIYPTVGDCMRIGESAVNGVPGVNPHYCTHIGGPAICDIGTEDEPMDFPILCPLNNWNQKKFKKGVKNGR